MHARLGRLHRVELIVDRACRAGEIEDLVDLDIQGERNVVPDQLEALVAQQVLDVAARAGEEVVNADELPTLLEQPFAEVRAEESGATGDQYRIRLRHEDRPLLVVR